METAAVTLAFETKLCHRCGERRAIANFSLASREKDGRQSACKDCNRAYRQANAARKADYQKQYYEQNRDRLIAQDRCRRAQRPKNPRPFVSAEERARKTTEKERKYRESHREEMRARTAVWYEKNRSWSAEKSRRRTATKLLAMPAWADPKKIAQVYADAARLTLETGIEHHVDHIVPLKSKLVCGLHCEANLQILPGLENVSKGNRWWPDMERAA